METTETKTKVKNREWVKNAAIIFLAVLLVLTFFSNTILNASLPEVATRDARGGTITARIRVTGNVTASQNYEVSIDESRRVHSVMVKTGQSVNAGDVLFILSEAESDELQSARDALRDLERSYQERLINASGKDYAREQRDIELARQNLEEAVQTLAEYGYNHVGENWALTATSGANTTVTSAQARVDAAERKADAAEELANQAQRTLDAAEKALSDLGARPTPDSVETLRKTAETNRTALNEEKTALDHAKQIYKAEYAEIEAWAEILIRQTPDYQKLADETARKQYIEERRADYEEHVMYRIKEGVPLPTEEEGEEGKTLSQEAEKRPYQKAYEEINGRREALAAAQEAYDAAWDEYNKALSKYDEYRRLQQTVDAAEQQVNSARQAIDAAAVEKSEADRLLADAKEKQQLIGQAVEGVKAAEKNLEDLTFALQETMKSDGKQSQLDALELGGLNERIETARQRVEELSGESESAEITAAVSGVITSISITAGQTTVPNSAMATIELPDMGYILTATVSNDQARRLHVGDSATVANAYWGSQIDATLTGISADPRDPQNSKQLTFELSGDVTAGGSLTLSVGERSAEYDLVVPNSALRSDANGDFVLVVSAKNSPLGARYTAMRVEVTKLAYDDTNTAVTGALEAGDFVITTSTAPIKNGDRVRLADTQDGAS